MTLNRTLMGAVAGVLALAVSRGGRRPVRPCAWSCTRTSRSSIRSGPRPTSAATTATWSTTRCSRSTRSSRSSRRWSSRYEISDDKLTYTFTLRDGLEFHDGAAGHRRGRDRLDRALGRARTAWASCSCRFVEGMKATDDEDLPDAAQGALRPGPRCRSPSRARTCPSSCPSGSPRRRRPSRSRSTSAPGPFVFERDEWEPGDKAVFTQVRRATSRAASRRPGRPAARSPRSTGSSGSGSPTCRPRSTR